MEWRSKGTHGAQLVAPGRMCGLRFRPEDPWETAHCCAQEESPSSAPMGPSGPVQSWGARGAPQKALSQGGGPGAHVCLCPVGGHGQRAPEAPSQEAAGPQQEFVHVFSVFWDGTLPRAASDAAGNGSGSVSARRRLLLRSLMVESGASALRGWGSVLRGEPQGSELGSARNLFQQRLSSTLTFRNGLHPI